MTEPTVDDAKIGSKQEKETATGAPHEGCYTRVVYISPPANMKWEPDRAQQLMVSLFSLNRPFKLAIQVNRSGIQWFAEAPHDQVNKVVQSLYASYQKAHIDVRPKDHILRGFYVYHFHTAAPFIAPLLYAEDFTLDSLTPLLSNLAGVSGGEEIVYELELRDAKVEHYKLGEKLSTRSLTGWMDFLTIGGTATAAIRKAVKADKVDKFVPTLQRLVTEKLNVPLMQVILAAKIQASSRARANELVSLLNPGLAQVGRPTCNFLVPAQKETFPLVLSPREAAALWHLPSDQCQIPGIAWMTSSPAPAPASVSRRGQAIWLGTNLYHGRSQSVWLAYPDRVTHVNVIGRTGTGKSTLLHNMIHQDIRSGKGVAVIDPHGDLVNRIVGTSVPPERKEDVILFDTTDSCYPIGLNFFAAPENMSPDTVASMTLAVIRKMFADSWSPTRMEDALYAALMAVQSVEGATIQDIARLFHDSAFRSQALKAVKDPVALEFWYEEYEQLSPSHQREFARPITNRLRKFYRNPRIRRIIGQKDSLDFYKIMDSGKIFLAKLVGIPEIEAETLGALLISKFQLAAMGRMQLAPEKRQPYYLYIDEVQNFTTTSLPTLFSEARKTGLNLVVSNQFLRQLAGATLESVMGNAGTTIVFAVGPKDAKTLAPFVRPQLTGDELVNLDRFNAVVKMQSAGMTQPAFSLQTPKPLSLPKDARKRFAWILNYGRQLYARHKDEVDAEMAERYQPYRQQLDTDSEDQTQESYFG